MLSSQGHDAPALSCLFTHASQQQNSFKMLQHKNYNLSVTTDAFGMNRNRWILSGYAHPPTLNRWQKTGPSMQMYEFVDCVLKTGGSSEALMQAKRSATLLLSSC